MKLLPSQYGRILFELTKESSGKDLDSIIKDFVTFLRGEQVISKIEYIIEEFVDYAKKQSGVKKLNVTTAKKLSEKQLKQIVSHFGSKVDLKSDADDSLIGGVIVRDGNTILDASIRRQLKKLKQQLS